MGSDTGSAKSKSSSKRVKFKDEYGNDEQSSEGSESSRDSDTHSDVSNMFEETKSNGLGVDPEIIIGPGNTNDVALHRADDVSGDSKNSGVSQGKIDGSEGDTKTKKFSSSSSSFSSSPLPSPSPSSSPGLSTDDQSQSDMKLSERITSGLTSKAKVSSVSTLIQSPPVQVMDRQVGKFDPNRIPSVVFAPNKSTPVDWSLASNDSLFSIKVESAVFARDPYKQSGEQSKRAEFKTSTPSTVVAPKVHTKSPKIHKIKGNMVSDNAVKDKTVLVAKQPIMEQPKLPMIPKVSNHYGESGAREQPFDFPVKNSKKNCAWASCSCSACSWAFCYCSNYSCALCYCWNCSIKRWCCDCCSDSKDENDVPEIEKAQQKQKHQEKPLASALKSKSFCSNCFSWFCCSPKDEDNVPEKEKAHKKQKQQEKPLASALISKSSCSNCCSWFRCCSEDENNVPEKEKAQHKQKHQEKPFTSALKSKSSCSNCFSWFPSCRWQWCSCCSSNCCLWRLCCSSNCCQWRSCCYSNCCQWPSCCCCNYCRRKCC